MNTQEDSKGKRNTALTSRLSWKEFKASGKLPNEKKQVLELLKAGPLNCRAISNITGIAIGNVTKNLNDLVYKDKQIVVSSVRKCSITGCLTKHYSLALSSPIEGSEVNYA